MQQSRNLLITIWELQMGTRDYAFISLCLAAMLALGTGLLRQDRIAEPESFRPAQYQDDDFTSVVAKVNNEFRQHWSDNQIEFAPRADDLTIARRLSLGLVGTIPSLEEIRELQKHDPLYRQQWWLSHLFEDRRYSDYMGERLARAYVGTENGPFLVYRRRKFVMWLSERLNSNARYDSIVRDLIADKGLWTDTPAVNFVTVTIDQNNDRKGPNPIRLAARTTRAFLGMRIDCLQCHDDRLGNVALGTLDDPRDGLQADFHQLAAFFSEAKSSLLGVRDQAGEEYNYRYLEAETEELIPPAVPFSPELLPEDGNRRQRLAKWVTHRDNKPFARAAVNRIWALMFGRPLVDPVDDIPLNEDFPPGLETLADDFVEHDFNIQRLIRVIAETEVFQIDSRAPFEITNKHESSFAAFPLSRLRPEQVAGSVIQASSLKTIDADVHIVFQLQRYNEQNEFIQRYGDPGDDEFVERGGTISQRLLMMNGDLVSRRSRANMISAANRIAQLTDDDKHAVEVVYLTVFSRKPSEKEQEHFVARLQEEKSMQFRTRTVEDMIWILLNSTEFSWNH
ncbi:MAG: hypothetical protein ACI9G1_004802 [Pirellulaceae bacterium]|jgi:hypothetical protein